MFVDQNCAILTRPACGERVGVRGPIGKCPAAADQGESPPLTQNPRCARFLTSPRERGEVIAARLILSPAHLITGLEAPFNLKARFCS